MILHQPMTNLIETLKKVLVQVAGGHGLTDDLKQEIFSECERLGFHQGAVLFGLMAQCEGWRKGELHAEALYSTLKALLKYTEAMQQGHTPFPLNLVIRLRDYFELNQKADLLAALPFVPYGFDKAYSFPHGLTREDVEESMLGWVAAAREELPLDGAERSTLEAKLSALSANAKRIQVKNVTPCLAFRIDVFSTFCQSISDDVDCVPTSELDSLFKGAFDHLETAIKDRRTKDDMFLLSDMLRIIQRSKSVATRVVRMRSFLKLDDLFGSADQSDLPDILRKLSQDLNEDERRSILSQGSKAGLVALKNAIRNTDSFEYAIADYINAQVENGTATAGMACRCFAMITKLLGDALSPALLADMKADFELLAAGGDTPVYRSKIASIRQKFALIAVGMLDDSRLSDAEAALAVRYLGFPASGSEAIEVLHAKLRAVAENPDAREAELGTEHVSPFEMAPILVEEFRPLLEALSKTSDLDALRAGFHTIKGTALSVGLKVMSQYAGELQNRLDAGVTSAAECHAALPTLLRWLESIESSGCTVFTGDETPPTLPRDLDPEQPTATADALHSTAEDVPAEPEREAPQTEGEAAESAPLSDAEDQLAVERLAEIEPLPGAEDSPEIEVAVTPVVFEEFEGAGAPADAEGPPELFDLAPDTQATEQTGAPVELVEAEAITPAQGDETSTVGDDLKDELASSAEEAGSFVEASPAVVPAAEVVEVEPALESQESAQHVADPEPEAQPTPISKPAAPVIKPIHHAHPPADLPQVPASMDTELLEVFLYEAEGLVNAISKAAERYDQDDIAAIKRDLHTLKGASNSCELTQIGSAVHEIEDALEGGVSKGEFNALFDSIAMDVSNLKNGRFVAAPLVDNKPAQQANRSNHADIRTKSASADVFLPEMDRDIGQVFIENNRLSSAASSISWIAREMNGTLSRLADDLRIIETSADSVIPATAKSRDGFDSLELDAYGRIHESTRRARNALFDARELLDAFSAASQQIGQTAGRSSALARSIKRNIEQINMVAWSTSATQLHRVSRMSIAETGNQAVLRVVGDGFVPLEIYRKILPAIEHLLRNAIAHAASPGHERFAAGKSDVCDIVVSCESDYRRLYFTVSDDGMGIDAARVLDKAIAHGIVPADATVDAFGHDSAVELIFHSGLSTAPNVTAVAGRGVGMDVVRNTVNEMGGTISVETSPEGTRFTLAVPMDTSAMSVIPVSVGGVLMMFPVMAVHSITKSDASNPSGVSYIAELDTRCAYTIEMGATWGGRKIAVDEVYPSRKVAIRSPGPMLQLLPGILGTALGDSGEVIMVLNPGRMALVDQKPGTSQHRILIADDSTTLRKLLAKRVKHMGLTPYEAEHGAAALSVLDAVAPSLIILDIEMPVMGGFEALEAIRQRSNVPVLMFSTRDTDKHREKAAALGADDFLSKGCEEAEFFEKVASLLGTSIASR